MDSRRSAELSGTPPLAGRKAAHLGGAGGFADEHFFREMIVVAGSLGKKEGEAVDLGIVEGGIVLFGDHFKKLVRRGGAGGGGFGDGGKFDFGLAVGTDAFFAGPIVADFQHFQAMRAGEAVDGGGFGVDGHFNYCFRRCR